MNSTKNYKFYLSLLLLFIPPLLFGLLLLIFREEPKLKVGTGLLFFPWQFWVLLFSGVTATAGGFLDWRFHRYTLNMKMSDKERNAEAQALGLGGIPMFILMWCAMLTDDATIFLVPILLVLIYTVVMICYDEFVFHRKRCGKTENMYHRMLVYGNGIAWLAWFHFIYC